jgi:opacity protein-like surface antigen
MKRMFVLLSMVFVFNSSVVFAERGDNYFRFSGSIVNLETQEFTSTKHNTKGTYKLDSGWGLSAAAGHRFNEYFRTEIEYTYREAALDKVEAKQGDTPQVFTQYYANKNLSNKTIMINGLYDMANDSIVTPYMGIGLGFTWFDSAIVNADKSELGYQLITGVNIEATENIDLNLGYKYHDTSDWEYWDQKDNNYGLTEGSYSSHNFDLGATLYF